MLEAARGIIVIADLDNAASLVLRAIAQGDFGPGPMAVMTVAERLRPAALALEGEGRVSTRTLLGDGRHAVAGAARDLVSGLALLGVEFSAGLSADEEARALAAGAQALKATYDPVIVLNRHMRLAPVLRRTIEMADAVVIIAGANTPVDEIQSFQALSRDFGRTPVLWFHNRGPDPASEGALRLSAAVGLSLWGAGMERAPDPAARIARVEGAPSPATSAPDPVGTDEADDLLRLVKAYLTQLQSLRQSRRQLAGTRAALQRLLVNMTEAVQTGGMPRSEEIGDLSQRHSALTDLVAHYGRLLQRCQADWNVIHLALDPQSDGPEP